MPDTTVVKNIKIVKNNTRPIEDTFFPNIDYREQEIIPLTGGSIRHTLIQSYIPVIRGDVYLVFLIRRYEDKVEIPNRKKEYIQRFLQEVNNIQQRYIVQEQLISVENFGQPLIYKMEY